MAYTPKFSMPIVALEEYDPQIHNTFPDSKSYYDDFFEREQTNHNLQVTLGNNVNWFDITLSSQFKDLSALNKGTLWHFPANMKFQML